MASLLFLLGLLGAIFGAAAVVADFSGGASLGGVDGVGVYPLEDPLEVNAPVVVPAILDLERLAPEDRTPERIEDLTLIAARELQDRIGGLGDVTIEKSPDDDSLRIEAWFIHPEDGQEARFENLVLRSGELKVLLLPEPEDYVALGTTREDERLRFDAWAAHDGLGSRTLDDYHRLPAAESGPTPGVRWAWSADGPKGELMPKALMVPRDPKCRIEGSWIMGFYPAESLSGETAIGFEVEDEHKRAFEAATLALVGRSIAFNIGEEVAVEVRLASRIRNGAVLTGAPGGFTEEKILDLMRVHDFPMSKTPLMRAKR